MNPPKCPFCYAVLITSTVIFWEVWVELVYYPIQFSLCWRIMLRSLIGYCPSCVRFHYYRDPYMAWFLLLTNYKSGLNKLNKIIKLIVHYNKILTTNTTEYYTNYVHPEIKTCKKKNKWTEFHWHFHNTFYEKNIIFIALKKRNVI